jgi:protease II
MYSQCDMCVKQDTAGSIVWANDNETLFYVTKDKLDRPYKVRLTG